MATNHQMGSKYKKKFIKWKQKVRLPSHILSAWVTTSTFLQPFGLPKRPFPCLQPLPHLPSPSKHFQSLIPSADLTPVIPDAPRNPPPHLPPTNKGILPSTQSSSKWISMSEPGGTPSKNQITNCADNTKRRLQSCYLTSGVGLNQNENDS